MLREKDELTALVEESESARIALWRECGPRESIGTAVTKVSN